MISTLVRDLRLVEARLEATEETLDPTEDCFKLSALLCLEPCPEGKSNPNSTVLVATTCPDSLSLRVTADETREDTREV